MIKKNVYIVYLAGYHGSYLKWAIEVSDIDRRSTIELDPLNRTSSSKFGGVGTSHGHYRIPTHQDFELHTSWVIRNKPVDPIVYIINPAGSAHNMQTLCYNLVQLLLQDPDGIIISINDGSNWLDKSYGRINCVTKWPTMMAAKHASSGQPIVPHKSFDPFNCASDRQFRNHMVTDVNSLTSNMSNQSISSPLNFDLLDAEVARYNNWYKLRNQHQPHEVNEQTYVTELDYKNRVYEFSIRDIPSSSFLPQLQHILETFEISNNFDLDIVKKYHHSYISVQPNLQWFDSVAHWELTGEIDDYLSSHSIIEAELIREIMFRCNIRYDLTELDHVNWRSFYSQVQGPDWPKAPITELGFYQLPAWVQEEILVNFGYKLKHQKKPNSIMLALDWQNMSLKDINQVYQTCNS